MNLSDRTLGTGLDHPMWHVSGTAGDDSQHAGRLWSHRTGSARPVLTDHLPRWQYLEERGRETRRGMNYARGHIVTPIRA